MATNIAADLSLQSGMVIKGVDAGNELASRLIKTSAMWGANCGIAVVNDTNLRLINPQFYLYSGIIKEIPSIVESGYTGLISALKVFGSPWATTGILTYEIESMTRNQLQVFWSVPSQISKDNFAANVSVGDGSASQALFESLSKTKTSSSEKIIEFKSCFMKDFEAGVRMLTIRPSPLTVTLRKIYN